MMRALYEQLYKLLQEQYAVYDEFIELLKQEWEIVVAYELPSLEQLTEQKEFLATKIQRLNLARENILSQIVSVSGAKGALDLKTIATHEGNPFGAKMATLRLKIKRQIDDIQELNQANENLIKRSRGILHQSISHLYQPEMDSKHYRSDGKIESEPLEGRLLSTNA